jgi:hypothetical protein
MAVLLTCGLMAAPAIGTTVSSYWRDKTVVYCVDSLNLPTGFTVTNFRAEVDAAIAEWNSVPGIVDGSALSLSRAHPCTPG